MNFPTPRWMLLLAGAVLIAPAAQAASEWRRNADWTRHFRVGMQLGLNIDADFSTAGRFIIAGSQPGAPGDSGVNHIYDDGYVRVDQSGNARGLTSYWGYNNNSQLMGQTLTFHSAKSFTVNRTDSHADDAPYIGFDMAYGGDLRRWGRARVGWELGVGILPIEIKDTRNLSGIFNTTVHRYNTGGIVVPADGYNGGPSGLGPTIPAVGTALDDMPLAGTIMGSRTLDVTLYSVRLGPTLFWRLHPRWAVNASAGGALGLVNGNYRFNEFTTFASGGTTRSSGKFGKTEAVFGGYVNAVLLFHVEANADLFIGAQFMSLSDARFSNGGRQARLNLGKGISFTTGINWPF